VKCAPRHLVNNPVAAEPGCGAINPYHYRSASARHEVARESTNAGDRPTHADSDHSSGEAPKKLIGSSGKSRAKSSSSIHVNLLTIGLSAS
jgi:hypothetical protein